MVVNFILLSIFEKVDLDKNPYIILLYKHILTLKSMDEYINISDFYTINAERLIVNLKNNAKSFFILGIKSYPTCRDPLRNFNRYSRIFVRFVTRLSRKKNEIYLAFVTANNLNINKILFVRVNVTITAWLNKLYWSPFPV